MVNVRYMVDDVEDAIAFYTKFLDFKVLTSFVPAFADVARGNLRLLLSGPTSSAGRPMPDGTKPGPGGWNRIHLIVDDIDAEVARLRDAGAPFRNDILAGTWRQADPAPGPLRQRRRALPTRHTSLRRHTMAKQTLPTRALLACGAVAGPLYVTVTMAQALTRDGFDLRQHRFTLLTTGDLGWIHQANMVLVGALTVLLAVGVRQMMRTGRGAVWGPRLLGLFGVAYIFGGVLTADPVAGFPPGTTPEMVQTTWQGVVQNASRSASSLAPHRGEPGDRGVVRRRGAPGLGLVLRRRHPRGVRGPDGRRLRHRHQPRRPGLSRDALDLGDGAGRTPVPTCGNAK